MYSIVGNPVDGWRVMSESGMTLALFARRESAALLLYALTKDGHNVRYAEPTQDASTLSESA